MSQSQSNRSEPRTLLARHRRVVDLFSILTTEQFASGSRKRVLFVENGSFAEGPHALPGSQALPLQAVHEVDFAAHPGQLVARFDARGCHLQIKFHEALPETQVLLKRFEGKYLSAELQHSARQLEGGSREFEGLEREAAYVLEFRSAAERDRLPLVIA